MNATRTGRRKRHAPVRKFTFIARPRENDAEPGEPIVISAMSVCAEDALRSVASDVPVGWSLIPAGSE